MRNRTLNGLSVKGVIEILQRFDPDYLVYLGSLPVIASDFQRNGSGFVTVQAPEDVEDLKRRLKEEYDAGYAKGYAAAARGR